MAQKICLLFIIILFTGCGGGGDGGPGSIIDPSPNVVDALLESIVLTPSESTIAEGISRQFTATGNFSDGTQRDITNLVMWSSSSLDVAAVSDTGLATAVAPGLSRISASLGSRSAAAKLTVIEASIASIAITPDKPDIANGTTQQFTAIATFTNNTTQDVTATANWTSDTSTVATIDQAGVATSVAPGQTIITATVAMVSGETTLNVTPAALVKLDVSPADALSSPGTQRNYRAVGTFTDGSVQDLTQQVSWSSDNNQVTMSSLGQATISDSATAGAVISITASLPGFNESSTLTLGRFAYVANRSGDSISMYSIAPNGAVSALTPSTVNTGAGSTPFSMEIAPNGRDLYASTSGVGTFTQYRIENNGQLTFVRDYDFKLSALSFTSAGDFAYGPDSSTTQIRMFSVTNDGLLVPTTPGTIPATGLSPTGVAIGVSDEVVYVANFQGDSVSMYAIEDGSGLLSPLTPATIPAGDTTRSIALTPNGQYAYASNQSDHTLSMYKIGPSGSLTSLNPATQAVGFTPLRVIVDPSGSYVYVSNNFDGTISQFGVGADGLLTPLSPPTVTDPGGQGVFEITLGATGEYLYATNRSTVSIYAVNANGTLSTLTPSSVPTAVSSAEIVVTP